MTDHRLPITDPADRPTILVHESTLCVYTNPMIARIWRGQALAANADAYHQHVTQEVFPKLKSMAGYRGAYLLQRTIADRVEFVALTWWDSLEAVKQFAGDDPDTAIVTAEARAVLLEFDDFARHYEVTYSS
jgi:heme-degrading monooxygenase HmoA